LGKIAKVAKYGETFSMHEDKLFYIITSVLGGHIVAMKHISVYFKTNESVHCRWYFKNKNLG
jgi:hypothetical protein